MARKRYCRNREVVNVGRQLYSPEYDFERDDGPAWYEWHMGDSGSMCGWNWCGRGDAERWRNAADVFIQGTLKKQLLKVRRSAEVYTGGGALPLETQGRLNEVKNFIKSWNGFRDSEEIPSQFNIPAIEGYIHKTIDYFDRAACYMDDPLNEIAEEIGALHIIKRAPVVPDAKSAPDGGAWIRGGRTGEEVTGPPGKGIGVLGWVAIGAAGYFGFKVLTE